MASDLVLESFQTKGRPTSRDMVAAELRKAIVRGDLAEGVRLNPTEIAERFGVSQTPAREALQLLATENLVRNDPFKGARVSELSSEEYEELYLMRCGLEGLAARLGAERISSAGIEEMSRMLEAMAAAAKANDIDLFYERDRHFHLVHYSAPGRESLLQRIMGLRVASERYARVAYVMPKVSMKDTLATHREILKAVKRRDGERCEAVIQEDLRRTLEMFNEQFGTSGSASADVS